jgi:Ala-tRNA(Pro) deacylase
MSDRAAVETLLADLGIAAETIEHPLALINDREGKVRLILDASLLEAKRLAFHPLTNTATTAFPARDLLALLKALAHPPEILALV